MEFSEIKELMRLFGKSRLERIKIKEKDFEIEMKKGGSIPKTETTAPAVTSTPMYSESTTKSSSGETSVSTVAVADDKKGNTIVSPMVGTFYASPSPDSPPFVEVGDTVRKGQTLCILEAMKIMNELEAEYDCKIIEVLVQDGEPVEYDKPLFVVEKL